MRVFVDTSVLMYAAGQPHPHRDACAAVVRRVGDGSLDAVTSTEVVQEILHRFSRGDRDRGARLAGHVLDLFGEVLSIDRRTIVDTVARYRREVGLSARDAIHVATCVAHDIPSIVSVDTDFDTSTDVRRIDPSDLAVS